MPVFTKYPLMNLITTLQKNHFQIKPKSFAVRIHRHWIVRRQFFLKLFCSMRSGFVGLHKKTVKLLMLIKQFKKMSEFCIFPDLIAK